VRRNLESLTTGKILTFYGHGQPGAVAIQNAKLLDQMKAEEAVRTNLARYLSPQIVDQVIRKAVQVNLGGDRKVVTVLFSDIRNFTRISESLLLINWFSCLMSILPSGKDHL